MKKKKEEKPAVTCPLCGARMPYPADLVKIAQAVHKAATRQRALFMLEQAAEELERRIRVVFGTARQRKEEENQDAE